MASDRSNADAQVDQSGDVDRQHLANVYAKALIAATSSSGKLPEVLKQLGSVVDDVLHKLPALKSVLESPRVKFDVKSRLIDQAFSKAAGSKELVNFLKVVARHDRLDCLTAIRRRAVELHDEMAGRSSVVVTTATSIDENSRDQIRGRLRTLLRKDVELVCKVDEKLIGGLIVRVGDTVYDASVANQLVRFRKDAIVKATQEIRKAAERFAHAP
jgi:F-type H+-transporting ATPase subunit delta